MTAQKQMIERSNQQPSSGDIDLEAAFGVRMPFAVGEEIYAQEEAADFIYRLVSGAVRTTHLLTDGRRQIGDFYYPGDVFGLEARATHRFSAEGLGNCQVQVLKRVAPSRQGEDRLRFDRMVSGATSNELERAQAHILLLARMTACEKVASFLLGLADRFKAEVTALPMSRQDMADYLGLTIETISRTLGKLQADGVVEFMGCRHFRIRHRTALDQLAVS
jgi:CRP/FNR family nitrogen fixation transcriptional regulator